MHYSFEEFSEFIDCSRTVNDIYLLINSVSQWIEVAQLYQPGTHVANKSLNGAAEISYLTV